MKKILIFALLTFALAGCTTTAPEDTNSSTNTNLTQENEKTIPQVKTNQESEKETMENITQATITTNMGSFTVEFYNEDSPKTVANFVKLAQDGFYDGTKFHRIIKDFMIQGGDPLSKDDAMKARWGTGGPGYQFADEFNSHKLVKGSLAMANSGPNTNGSQFFIVTADATSWLDGIHTNFGQVTDGLDVVEKIGLVAVDGGDKPIEAVVVEKIELE